MPSWAEKIKFPVVLIKSQTISGANSIYVLNQGENFYLYSSNWNLLLISRLEILFWYIFNLIAQCAAHQLSVGLFFDIFPFHWTWWTVTSVSQNRSKIEKEEKLLLDHQTLSKVLFFLFPRTLRIVFRCRDLQCGY